MSSFDTFETKYPIPSLIVEKTKDIQSLYKMGKSSSYIKEGFLFIYYGRHKTTNVPVFLIDTSILNPSKAIYRNRKISNFLNNVNDYEICVIYPKYKRFSSDVLEFFNKNLNYYINMEKTPNFLIENFSFNNHVLVESDLFSSEFYESSELTDIVGFLKNIIQNYLHPKDINIIEAADYMTHIIQVNSEKVRKSILENSMYKHAIKDPASLVVGIIGAWGVGKTTYINEMLHYSDTKIVINFDPWSKNSTDIGITVFLLNEIIRELQYLKNNKTFNGENIKPLLSLFSTIIDMVLISEGVVPLSSPIMKFLETKPKEPKSFSYLFEKAYESALKLEQPIIIVIDNLDRLLPDELISVIKLIRGTISIPNIIFILGYDERIIHKSLSDKKFNGTKYFKKIIDEKKYILPPSLKDIKETINKEFPKESQRNDVLDLVEENPYLVESFSNFRDLNLLIKEVKRIYATTQIDLKDLFLIEEIKATNLDLWYFLLKFKNEIYNFSKDSKVEKQLRKKLKKKASKREIILVEKIFPFIFSDINTHKGNSNVILERSIGDKMGISFNRNSLKTLKGLDSYFEKTFVDDFYEVELSKEVYHLIKNNNMKLSEILSERPEFRNLLVISLLLSTIKQQDFLFYFDNSKTLDFYETIFQFVDQEKQRLGDIENDLNVIDGKISRALSFSAENEYNTNGTIEIFENLLQISYGKPYETSVSLFIWLLTNDDIDNRYAGWRFFPKEILGTKEAKINKNVEEKIVTLFPINYKDEVFNKLIAYFWKDFALDNNYNIDLLDKEDASLFSKFMTDLMVKGFKQSLEFNSTKNLKKIINEYLFENPGILLSDKENIKRIPEIVDIMNRDDS